MKLAKYPCMCFNSKKCRRKNDDNFFSYCEVKKLVERYEKNFNCNSFYGISFVRVQK